jgi:hypothetical protein
MAGASDAPSGAGVALGLGTPDQGSTSFMKEAVDEARGSKSDEVNVDWNAVGRFLGALLDTKSYDESGMHMGHVSIRSCRLTT